MFFKLYPLYLYLHLTFATGVTVKAFYKRKLDEGCAKAVKAQKAKDDVKRIMDQRKTLGTTLLGVIQLS